MTTAFIYKQEAENPNLTDDVTENDMQSSVRCSPDGTSVPACGMPSSLP